jgi:transposase-like protein
MKLDQEFNSIIDLVNTFPDQQSCIDYLEKVRWPEEVISPFDASSKVYKCKGNKYRCKNTNKYFNVKTGTMFDNTKLPLQKWFLAIWLITSHKKGISSLQLGRDINITQKSAWFMLQRIRACFGIEDEMLEDEVEMDEAFIGGKNKNRHEHKKVKNAQGRSLKDKTPVVGMVQREGKLKAFKTENTKKKTLTEQAVNNIKKDSIIYTDEWKGYNGLKKVYDHSTIKHKKKEYVRGRVHTNTIEGFWSLLKRGIDGIYHSVSTKHLQKYVDEFVFRYNSRRHSEYERFNMFFWNLENRLTYNELIK